MNTFLNEDPKEARPTRKPCRTFSKLRATQIGHRSRGTTPCQDCGVLHMQEASRHD
jgi:hypothetical protein